MNETCEWLRGVFTANASRAPGPPLPNVLPLQGHDFSAHARAKHVSEIDHFEQPHRCASARRRRLIDQDGDLDGRDQEGCR